MRQRWYLCLCAVVGVLMVAACGGDPEPSEQNNNPVILLDENNATQGNNTTANNTVANNTAPNSEEKVNAFGQFDDCPVEARPVYVIDGDSYMLSSFQPDTREFNDVGLIRCPSQDPQATPFSMSVDRDAQAWVLFTSGEIFLVNTTNAECLSTRFQPNNGFALFGMGFVLDSPESDRDVLYIAGGDSGDLSEGSAGLGRVNFAETNYSPIASLQGWPELTGTALGELWGFFPATQPPRVAQIDRVTGEEKTTFPVSGIDGEPNAWAFAFWGGNFYLFYKSRTDPSTRIFELNGKTGNVDEIISDSGRYIVGAGVSTCAPTQQM